MFRRDAEAASMRPSWPPPVKGRMSLRDQAEQYRSKDDRFRDYARYSER